MGTAYPPPPPPPPAPPRSNTLLAVIIGVLVLLVIVVGAGVVVLSRFLRDTRIVTAGYGTHQVTHISSPLGNLNVQGDGENARLSIQSPFGSVKVFPRADLSQLDMTIYPGATEVLSSEDSPFHNSGMAPDGIGGLHGFNLPSPGAEVMLRAPVGSMLVNEAEFRTTAAPEKILAYYQQQLARFGSVETKWDGAAHALEVKLSDTNVRYVAVRRGRDGTHFVLVRAEGGHGDAR
ncbi:MAG: hypothetical protein ACRD04_10305 [Terriglobales bacterium]